MARATKQGFECPAGASIKRRHQESKHRAAVAHEDLRRLKFTAETPLLPLIPRSQDRHERLAHSIRKHAKNIEAMGQCRDKPSM